MRSAVVTAPGRMEIQEKPVPRAAPGWVVVRVRAMGVCGTDLEILNGSLPYLRKGGTSYPIVPGHEWSGEIAAVGDGVDGLAPGERVTGETHLGCGRCERCRAGRLSSCESVRRVGIGDLPGGCAEYLTVPASSLHRLPDGVGFVTAAVLEPVTVALHAVTRAGLWGGEHVVVVGSGTIGLLATAVSRSLGAGRVTLLGTREERLAVGRRMGATATVNVRDGAELLAGLAGQADMVVDAAGDPSFVAREISLLRKGGSLVVVGLFDEPVDRLDLTGVVTRNLSILGSLGGSGVWDRAIAMVGAGQIDPSPIVTHRFPLDQAEKAFHTAADRATGAIKVIIEPWAGNE